MRVFLGKGSVSCDRTNLFTLNVTLQTLYKQFVIVCLFGNRILTVHSNLRGTIISLFLSIPSLSLYQHNYTVERRGQIEREIATLFLLDIQQIGKNYYEQSFDVQNYIKILKYIHTKMIATARTECFYFCYFVKINYEIFGLAE